MCRKNTSCEKSKISCVPAVMDACFSFKRGESDILDGHKGPELASAMDCTASVALNKLNPNNEHNTPTLKDAIKLTDHFNDDRILREWACKRGFLLVEKIEPEDVDEEEILDAVLNLNNKLGDLGSIYHHARQDGVIDPKEFELIENAAVNLRRATALVQLLIETQVRELPKTKGVIIDG